MTVNATVLRKLADWRPSGNGRQTLAIPDEGAGWSLTVTANRRDDVGCVLEEVVLQATLGPAARRDATLTSWARRAAERVRGLLEPLRVVEIDLLRGG